MTRMLAPWVLVAANLAFAALPPYGALNLFNLACGVLLALVLVAVLVHP